MVRWESSGWSDDDIVDGETTCAFFADQKRAEVEARPRVVYSLVSIMDDLGNHRHVRPP